jgi:GGDEF domain-containing protein
MLPGFPALQSARTEPLRGPVSITAVPRLLRWCASAGIFGLIYVDLDEFKQVNDGYGHQAGDLYLKEAVLRMKRQLRPHDMLARLGGDEFAVLASGVRSRTEVEEVARRLERSFDDLYAVDGYVLSGLGECRHRTLPGGWHNQGQPVERSRRSHVCGEANEATSR